ncbi:Ni2+-binding GTPase, urease/hydrogenase maturation protein [Saccharomonospora cyanea NA-134]|uniref:Ni2+-binding GTPase, urease/hydrogenase maturation protein n=1 Tax=Saccharomonospora cyanea NA-134 TaxID=882082 RepID=H5XQX8_9PSEU|nr:Ni2+-binding GTPase, urease/hydrogenase maturation protein [Saccharomonospora cyanea NA-134]
MPESNTTKNEPVRALRLGVAGPVGTGKSSLIATLCRDLADEFRLGVLTDDIYTDEDARFLRSAGVLPAERIRAIEIGACPHTAIRDDVSTNLLAVEDLEHDFAPLDIVLVESGGDNLTATFCPALVDAQIFVLDVAGATSPARAAPASPVRTYSSSTRSTWHRTSRSAWDGWWPTPSAARAGAPVLPLSRERRNTVEDLCTRVRALHSAFRSGQHAPIDPGPMAPTPTSTPRPTVPEATATDGNTQATGRTERSHRAHVVTSSQVVRTATAAPGGAEGTFGDGEVVR